jgi:methyl-accepting chemotaxis protein
VNPSLLLIVVLAATVLLALFFSRRLIGRRQRAMHQLLDAADALETRLRTARSEIEAVAGDLVEDPVHDAMREMLRQRLWLRGQGQHASVEELQQVRRSIVDASDRIEQQLRQIQRARAPVN